MDLLKEASVMGCKLVEISIEANHKLDDKNDELTVECRLRLISKDGRKIDISFTQSQNSHMQLLSRVNLCAHVCNLT